MTSEYERKKQENIRKNTELLASLGLDKPILVMKPDGSPQPKPLVPARLIIYVYEGIRKIGPVRDSHELTVELCREMFPVLELANSLNIGICTKDLDICNDQQAEIFPETWQHVVNHLREVVIIDRTRTVVIHGGRGKIFVNKISKGNSNYSTIVFVVDLLTCTVGDLMARIEELDMIPVERQRLCFDGNLLRPRDKLCDCDIDYDSSLDLFLEQRGKKPVIYLLAPVSVDASVELSLVPQWSLSAIYPVTSNIKSGAAGRGQRVSWRVRVHPEGHLTELSTGLDIAYLFWEALTNPLLPSSPPASPLLAPDDKVQAFDPTNVSLNDENAVIISVHKVTPYLDAALKVLGLQVEARTSFITYWLPFLLEHKYIAFRFLPQASYEQAARLKISPTPDVVTRIFMVFKGIEESELGAWPAAWRRINDDVSAWINVVGVDVGRSLDKGLFRVIEWGGILEFLPKFRFLVYYWIICTYYTTPCVYLYIVEGHVASECPSYLWFPWAGFTGLGTSS